MEEEEERMAPKWVNNPDPYPRYPRKYKNCRV
jgi:hypothetical protein